MLIMVMQCTLRSCLCSNDRLNISYLLPFRFTIGERTADEMRSQREKLEETGDHVSNYRTRLEHSH